MKTSTSYNLPKKLAAQAMHETDVMLSKQHEKGIFDDGDPNHPKWNNGINYVTGLPVSLFGYDTASFMRQQY